MINIKFTLFLKSLLRNLCLSAMLLLVPMSTLAWNSNAHRVIAEIAWENLTMPARAQVGCLVRQFQRSWPQVKSFQQMAVWPDTLKSQGITAFNQWHFIAQPFSTESNKVSLPRINDENGVWAVQQGVTVLMDGNRDPAMQAWFLAFVAHIVGDLHQPLHTITRVSSKHPQGDLGGNLFMINYPGASNLHQLWDQSLGALPKDLYQKSQVIKIAHELQRRYPQKRFAHRAQDLDPNDWAKESFALGKSFAYQLPENSRPSKHYIKQGQEIALKQIALAGYRLANLLNHIAQDRKYSAGNCSITSSHHKNSPVELTSYGPK